MAEEYKGSLSGYLEEILEFQIKDTLNNFISIFHKNDIVNDNIYNYYSIILGNFSLANSTAFWMI